jgi:aspartokinase
MLVRCILTICLQAIVSLVGKQLKNMIGISGRFFSVLGQNNINIEMISQGMLRCQQLYLCDC